VIGGSAAPGYDPVVRAFAQMMASGDEAGVAFAAVVDGVPVVDLWAGIAQREPPRPWAQDTVQLIFSGSKGLVATCILLLLDRGQLSLDRPVSSYWPAFGAAGKGALLVSHLVSHQAGLPAVEPLPHGQEALDPVEMAARLAHQPTRWPPGTAITYHALTFGWLCDGLVRQVDGRSVGRYFAEEIAGPLGLDTWIGLPETAANRVATMLRAPDYEVTFGDVNGEERELLTRIYAGGGIVGERFIVNDREFLRAEVAGVNGVATARSMARLYGCLANDGVIDGVRLLSRGTVQLALAPLARGTDKLTHKPLAFSCGFELQSELQWYGPAASAFGHSGAGGSVHGAWPQLRTGFSFATNLMRRDDRDGRAQRLLGVLHAAVNSTRGQRSSHNPTLVEVKTG
jgi:CubicO group peptidase (beta-lactamase class C family)